MMSLVCVCVSQVFLDTRWTVDSTGARGNIGVTNLDGIRVFKGEKVMSWACVIVV